jgi:hypothetical protein
MDSLRRKQRAAVWIAVSAAVLAFLAALGGSLLPAVGGVWVWSLHPFMLALGTWGGRLTSARNRQIERQRWEVVQDPAVTKGEREWAHKEAEAERKRAAVSFLTAPLLVAGWLAYSFREGAPTLASDLMPVSALLGFGLGLAWAHLSRARASPSHSPLTTDD